MMREAHTGMQQTTTRPPGPRGWELLKAVAHFRRDSVGCLLSLRQRYGTVVWAGYPERLTGAPASALGQLLGEPARGGFLFSAPEAIHAIFHTHRDAYRKGTGGEANHWGGPLLGDSLQVRDGAGWKERHQQLAPLFKGDAVSRYVELITPTLEAATAEWRQNPDRELVQDLSALTLRSSLRYLYGEVSPTEYQQLQEYFSAIDGFLRNTHFVIPVPLWLPLKRNQQFQAALTGIRALTLDLCRRRRESGAAGTDLLSRMLTTTGERAGGMTDEQILHELQSMFLAGHITTHLSLVSTFRFILSIPELQERIEHELDTVMTGPVPTGGDLERLEFLEQVWRESLRLCPPAGVMSRHVIQEHTIDGWTVPADSLVLVSPWVVHRDPQLYPDPNEFRPERWVPEKRKALLRYAFFPFGGGERVCIGQALSRLVVLTLLGTVLKHFRLKPKARAAAGSLLSSASTLKQLPISAALRT